MGKLSASASIKEESKKVSEDEESEEENEKNDEDHQVPAEDQADQHFNVASLPQKPTGLSYYASSTWYVKNHVFIDFIWACVISIYYFVFKFDNKSIGMTLYRNTENFNFTFYILLLLKLVLFLWNQGIIFITFGSFWKFFHVWQWFLHSIFSINWYRLGPL